MLAKAVLDRNRFGYVAKRRRCAVRIDVIHLLPVEAGIPERIVHAFDGTRTVFTRRRNMICIRAHSITGELAVDVRATRSRMLVLLEHQYAGAFAENESIAARVPRPAGACRIIVAGGECPGGAESTDSQSADTGLRAARDHHRRVAKFDVPCGLSDRVIGRGAGRHEREVGTFQAIHDRQLA